MADVGGVRGISGAERADQLCVPEVLYLFEVSGGGSGEVGFVEERGADGEHAGEMEGALEEIAFGGLGD